jgi:hypothetical protein
MGMLRVFRCWLMWRLFRWPSVVLVDHDGELNARLVFGTRQHPIAQRHGFGVRSVVLLDDGRTRGACYVTSWEPLFPPREPPQPVFHEGNVVTMQRIKGPRHDR